MYLKLCYNRFIYPLTYVLLQFYSLKENLKKYLENIYGAVNHPYVLQQDAMHHLTEQQL